MIHFFINALAASAGGGLTYVRNVIPTIGARADVKATVLVGSELRQELDAWANVELLETPNQTGPLGRFWFEQWKVPALIRGSAADVLLSTGNFALWNSPVPQILLSRNALYTSSDFMNDLRRRGDYRLWLDTQLKSALAKASIGRADVTVAPSASFAEELRQWSGRKVLAIHHGFDATALAGEDQLPSEVQNKLAEAAPCLRLLFVSHYNYYRNFETLLRAIPLLRDRLPSTKIRVFLTCKLKASTNPGSYQADSAVRLVQDLDISENIVELGSIPYSLLHNVYRASDIYVTPAYAESFAHPLVEAMSTGLPIVASDISVHREICEEAALYFSRFSAEELSDLVERIANRKDVAMALSSAGRQRSRCFSWHNHVDQIVELARQVSSDYFRGNSMVVSSFRSHYE